MGKFMDRMLDREEAREKKRLDKMIEDAGRFLIENALASEVGEIMYLALGTERADVELDGAPDEIETYNKLAQAQLVICRQLKALDAARESKIVEV